MSIATGTSGSFTLSSTEPATVMETGTAESSTLATTRNMTSGTATEKATEKMTTGTAESSTSTTTNMTSGTNTEKTTGIITSETSVITTVDMVNGTAQSSTEGTTVSMTSAADESTTGSTIGVGTGTSMATESELSTIGIMTSSSETNTYVFTGVTDSSTGDSDSESTSTSLFSTTSSATGTSVSSTESTFSSASGMPDSSTSGTTGTVNNTVQSTTIQAISTSTIEPNTETSHWPVTDTVASSTGRTMTTESTTESFTTTGISMAESSTEKTSLSTESSTEHSTMSVYPNTTESETEASTVSIVSSTESSTLSNVTSTTESTSEGSTKEITSLATNTTEHGTETSTMTMSTGIAETSTVSLAAGTTVTSTIESSTITLTTEISTIQNVTNEPITTTPTAVVPPSASASQTVIIVMGTIIPILLIFILVVLVIVLIRKKRKNKSADLYQNTHMIEIKDERQDGSMSVVNETTNLSRSLNTSLASMGSIGKRSQGSIGSSITNGQDLYVNVPSRKAIPVNRLQAYVIAMQKKKGFEKEYKALPTGMVLPHKDGLLEENRSKNRYINMIAYDHSRVVLEKDDGDYINANCIDGFIRRNAYIATQGPTRNTTEDFWHMIWQEEVCKIVMLTNLVESNKVKCYKYWPTEDSDLLLNSMQISLNSEETYPSFIIRKISMIDVEMNETRNIIHFQFTAWPDHGVPDPFQIMIFHRKILQQTSSLGGPMVVHCSAGVGRTGTLIAIDSLFKQGESSYYLGINQYVKDMRQNRVNMVQTLSQYVFIHTCLLEMFACSREPVVARDMFYQLWADPLFKDKIHDEYLSLMALRPEFDKDEYTIAHDPVNIDKHRDSKVMAADKYRAYLQSYSVNRTDYINAVIIPSHYCQQGYILTQFPLKSTVIDLWQMLYDYQSNTVVVADVFHFDEEDNGVFWPAIGESMTLGAFVIHCVAQTGNRDMTFNLSNKKATEYSKKSLDIRVLIGAGWSKRQDVPGDADYWFELHNDIHKWQEAQGQKPVTVICRDGGSRGALYCAVSNVLDGLDIYQDVDVFHAFRQIHNRKPEVLTFKEQYEHCYEVARLYLDAGSLYSS